MNDKNIHESLKELNNSVKIPDPEENFQRRIYATIPVKNYQFLKNKMLKFSLATVAILLLVFVNLPKENKQLSDDYFKPTKTIIIEDKLNSDYFKPTKVVTITEADQL